MDNSVSQRMSQNEILEKLSSGDASSRDGSGRKTSIKMIFKNQYLLGG